MICIKDAKKIDVASFAEEYLGIKLFWYQKVLLKWMEVIGYGKSMRRHHGNGKIQCSNYLPKRTRLR